MISPEKVEEILQCAKIEEVISDFENLTKVGISLYCVCPSCGKKGKGKGLQISPAKNICKCFSCDFGGNALHYLVHIQKMDYVEAIKYVAKKYFIEINDEKKEPLKKNGVKLYQFRDKQLASSGLTDEDQKIFVPVEENDPAYIDRNTQKQVNIFDSGTRNQYFHLVDGDDMIIWYYDLEGKPIMYQKPKGDKFEHLFRMRWQNPEVHCDASGRPKKYESPYKSGTHLFIPEPLRKAYQEGRQFKRLYLQEGEKKAWKACNHGMMSVGIMGIQNIANNKQLPYDFELIIKRCGVTEVVMVIDSDWDHLNTELKSGMRVDQRPWSFFHAVKNFKEYFKTFTNQNLYLEIYFAYLLTEEKGVDDLLAGSLKGKEKLLFDDIETAINANDKKGEYIQFHKISTLPDLKILEFWKLHSAKEFSDKYKERLIGLAEFQIGKHKWKFDETETLISTQPLEEDEQFWEVTTKESKSGEDYSTYSFSYIDAYTFLQRRGFGRIKMNGCGYIFARIQNNIIETWLPGDIKDFVVEFAFEVCRKEEKKKIMNMLYRGAKMYLGPDSLSHLQFIEPHFEPTKKDSKILFFNDRYWKITAEGVEEKPLSALSGNVWSEKLISFEPKYLGADFISFAKLDRKLLDKNTDIIQSLGYVIEDYDCINDWYNVGFSKAAEKCHFLSFLLNASDFFWSKRMRKDHSDKVLIEDSTVPELYEKFQHLLSKLTGLAYLIHGFRNKSCERMVIGMDGRNCEIGESNGRSGKSLVGEAVGEVIPQCKIPGKSKNLTEDPFLYEEVTEKHENIFIDDVRANVDIESFFPIITGILTINGKGIKKNTLTGDKTPFLYMTTNHSVNGSSASYRDRQFMLAFSDFYSDIYKPVDDFGVNFFTEWDFEQRNLFFNMIASALVIYFKAMKNNWGLTGSGLIAAPVARLEKRQMRQAIGETFLTWCDGFYGVLEVDGDIEVQGLQMDQNVSRKFLYDDFNAGLTLNEKKYFTPQSFKKRFKLWCKYHEFYFNKHKIDKEGLSGGDEKRDGVEYFTISKA